MTALLKILGTQQRFSTAYHTQTDGQTERMNRILEDILRHFVAPHHTDWDEHIAMAEFAIDNSHQDQESINTTPFRLNIFKDPPTPLSNKQGCKVPAAQAFANKMQEALLNAKKALKAAQQRRRSMLTKIDAMSLSQLKMRHFLVLKTSGIETLVVHLNSYLRGSVPSLS